MSRRSERGTATQVRRHLHNMEPSVMFYIIMGIGALHAGQLHSRMYLARCVARILVVLYGGAVICVRTRC